MDSAQAPRQASLRRRLLGALALLAAVLAVYFPALRGEFVYDDLLVIQQNPLISDLANLPAAFGSSYWDFLDAEGASHVGYYRPLTMVLLTLAQALGDGAPATFHWLSLLVYAASCWAAWRFAARLLRSEAIGFWAALLFALHPLHVESVAWISGLHDPLFALFGFLALERFLRWRDGGSRGLPWASGGLFLLALLSKDAAVAIVPLALAIDWGRQPERPAPGRWSARELARAFGPMLAAFGVYYLARVAVFGDPLAGFDRQTTYFGVGAGRLLLLRAELLGGAAALLVWPAELNLFRPFQPQLSGDGLLLAALGSAAVLALIVVAWRRRWRPALALLLILPAGLAPVLLRVESLGTFPLSDRFLFVPVIGATGLVAWLAWTRLPRPAALGLLAALGAALGARSAAHLPNWANEESMFRTAVEQNPRNPNVYWGLGRVLLERYRETGLSDPLLEARARFEQSMDLLAEAQSDAGGDIFATQDDHLQTHLGLGWALLLEAQVDPFHDYASARELFERAARIDPNSERAHVGIGVAWMAQGEPNAAGEALRKALQLNPNSPEAHFNMGELYMRIGEWTSAAREFEACTRLRNSNARDLVFLARALMEAGDDEQARRHAQRAHELAPEGPDAMVLLGTLDARAKRLSEALRWFDRALEVAPGLGEAHLQRGNALAAMERRADAVTALKEACRILPDRFQPHYDLAVLLLASNQPETAIPYFLAAYRLRRPEFDLRMKKAAAAIHRDDVRLLGALAGIDADRGDLATARSWIEQALAIAPEDPANNYLYGLVLLKQQEPDAAFAPLRLAAEELPGSYEAQMEFAGLLLQLDRPLESEPYLQRARVLLEDQEMERGLKDATRQTIESTLAEIAKLRAQVPGQPGSDG